LSDREEGIARDIAITLLALTVLLVVFQYHTLVKFSVLPSGATSWDLGTFVDTVRQKVTLNSADGILCGLILMPVIYILYAEARHRRLQVSWRGSSVMSVGPFLPSP
jgi:hypothetical protein